MMKKVKAILFSLALSYICSFLLVALAAFIVSKTGALPMQSLSVITTLLCCASVMAGGYLVSVILKERGILYGTVTALIYVLVLAVVTLCISKSAPDLSAASKVIAIIISGAIGGILAVNRKEKLRF